MWYPQGIFSEYVLRTPSILVGRESVWGLCNYPSSRIAIIHGTSFSDYDLFKAVFKKKEIQFFIRSWASEPLLTDIRETLCQIENYAPDTIIAVGGGSVIDGAKLCRLFFEIPYYEQGVTRLDQSILKTSFIAIPSTVGSGSEVSSSAVYLSGNHKEMIVLHDLLPDVIVYDERFIETLPKRILCSSALDAMSHIIEGYVSKVDNSFIDIKAEEGLLILKKELSNLIEDNKVNYRKLQYAGLIGGQVQNHCIVGAAHAIAHQLTQYSFSHAEAVSLLLPYVIKLNFKRVPDRYNVLCKNSEFNHMNDLILFIQRINSYSGVVNRTDELRNILLSNINNNEFLENIKNDRSGKGNPIEITKEFFEELVGSI